MAVVAPPLREQHEDNTNDLHNDDHRLEPPLQVAVLGNVGEQRHRRGDRRADGHDGLLVERHDEHQHRQDVVEQDRRRRRVTRLTRRGERQMQQTTLASEINRIGERLNDKVKSVHKTQYKVKSVHNTDALWPPQVVAAVASIQCILVEHEHLTVARRGHAAAGDAFSSSLSTGLAVSGAGDEQYCGAGRGDAGRRRGGRLLATHHAWMTRRRAWLGTRSSVRRSPLVTGHVDDAVSAVFPAPASMPA
ncbi:hypothetical protein OsI_22250 [Oryza sativa Indica Group]|uniref:Uncharacterized protein n=2 Tax=Oryza sativa TaxID=4530 RepID=Q67X55_ORYSJ|nr:hypothetical protein OsI_22250 [Oryza sativa Indica Group]EEE65378.1 hypothetical protein OsJ_20686 [Oryza sativa Japonica Group]BAD37264.1 hypothetical protein [Oryza sativa Japonica Group]BAD37478.1 hypothetical protein [Oryza sativa Japonica Group]